MTESGAFSGGLVMGDVMTAAVIDASQVMLIRHTYQPDGLGPGGLTDEAVLAYTCEQGVYEKGVNNHKLGPAPPPLWLCFMADDGLHCRFLAAYDNRGELVDEHTAQHRYFDLRSSSALAALKDRLVIEWSRDPVNWAKIGTVGSAFPVIEIADPQTVPFPGFDKLLVDYNELQAVVGDARYASWRTALGSVQGIYLIADTTTGRLYVGKGRRR